MKIQTWQDFWKAMYEGSSTKEETREFLSTLSIEAVLTYDNEHPLFQETAHSKNAVAEAVWDFVAENEPLRKRVHDPSVVCKYGCTAFEHLNFEVGNENGRTEWKRLAVEKLEPFKSRPLRQNYIRPMLAAIPYSPSAYTKLGWIQ